MNRKLLPGALCGVLTLALCGCAEQNSEVATAASQSQAQNAPEAATYDTFKLDLTKAQVDETKWVVKEAKIANGEKVLHGALVGSARIPFDIRTAGPYDFHIAFYTEKNKAANIQIVIRNPQGEAIACRLVDRPKHGVGISRPYEGYSIERPEGPRAGKFSCTFEFPGTYTLQISRATAKGQTRGNMYIESIFVSSRRPANVKDQVPEGFVEAPVLPLHTNLYCGIPNLNERFQTALIQNGMIYVDLPNMVSLGVNHEQGWRGDANERYGVTTIDGAAGGIMRTSREFDKAHPAPEGRFVNAEGKPGRGYSLAYDPAVAETERLARENFEKLLKAKDPSVGPMVKAFSICGESGGNLDYSPAAQEKFRAWLKEKYKTIDKLNEAWRTQHKDFAEIKAATSIEESKPCYFEYRDFCSKLFVKAIDRAARRVRAMDPRKRSATAQFSNFDFGAAGFFRYRPVDLEELILDGMKNADNYAWDGYCCDDYMGAEVDMAYSFARGKKIYEREFNTHNPDWRIAARTYWGMIGKGVKGVSLFQFHEGAGHDSYPKWGLTNVDMSPRDKLFAYSDEMQEVHHLENILVPARRVNQEKPVAIYWSRLDLQLQTKPLSSSWGEAIDSFYHVYEMLRGRGYEVTFITPRQIRDGFLRNVSAVVLVDVQHIAADVVKRLIDWNKQGGALIADSWPGAYNDLGLRQEGLMSTFGFKPAVTKKIDSVKIEESGQGYGEMTIAAINPDTVQNTVTEVWQEWDAEHPVAKAMGNFMFSGYGAQRVECTAGEVIGMTFGGHPGIILNQNGRGSTLYFAAMLGSYYGGSATRYEWDFTHQANDPARLLDEFLKFAGAKKGAIATLPERIAFKLRVEAPLMDAKGNAVITLQSYNDDVLRDFPLSLAWSKNRPAPKKIFAAVGGSRKLTEVPFKRTDDRIELTMPGFDSHATLILLQNADPILSLDFPNAKRGIARLIDMVPSQEETVTVTVHNPSAAKLAAGKVEARLPQGWFCSAASADVPEIEPWGSASVTFRVKAPAFCSMKRARPLTFVWKSGKAQSMPATEVVRWKPE